MHQISISLIKKLTKYMNIILFFVFFIILNISVPFLIGYINFFDGMDLLLIKKEYLYVPGILSEISY